VRPSIPRIVLPLALVAAFAPVLAAPLPAPRQRPVAGAAAPAPEPLGPVPAGDPAGACGTRLEAAFELAERRASEALPPPQPTPNSVDTAGIAVLEDDGTFFYADKGGNMVLDVAAVTQAFYRTHDDDVEFVAVYLGGGLTQWLGTPTAFAAAWPIRNAISGLGLASFDLGSSFGSPSRLETVLTLNGLHLYPEDPDEVRPGDTFSAAGILAHEFGHRWLAYTYLDSAGVASPALLGRDREHWNFFFDVDSSFMEGCDWTAVSADSFVTTGATTTYGALDQYLMGLRAKSEVDSLLVINDPTDLNPPGVYVPWSIPAVGVSCDGRATRWTVDDIERVHGPRVPDAANAPHAWSVAFALVTPRGQGASAADLARAGALRARFTSLVPEATGGRGAVDVTLPSRPGQLAIAHEPLADTEDPGAPRAVRARIVREGGALPLGAAPIAAVLHWRQGSGGPFAELPMAPAGPDSFAAELPATGGALEYWLSAAHPALPPAQLPVGGPAEPFAYVTGPDTEPPAVAHVPVPVQADTRMPQVMLARVTDNLGVDSVWCEASVDGGVLLALPVTPAGHDSFTVALGAGVFDGHHVAYRFVARDAALAANLGYSNAAFDTLRVGRDIIDDFENPSGYLHLPAIWSYRDPWDTDAFRSSPAGGTSWHFGAAGGLPYPPHSDAVLYTPWAYGIEAGASLRFDEWHDFEQANGGEAWDGFRIEVQDWGASPVPVEPVPGYTHVMRSRSLSIPRLAACWSGQSPGWVTRTLDLSPWAPGPVRLLVRACADEWLGAGGLWIDRVRVHHPGSGPAGVPPAGGAVACGAAWPNPTRGTLRLPLALARATDVDWSLHDVQGRRVATLWRGEVEPGSSELVAAAPGALAPGLYFARVRADGRDVATQRIAIVR